MLDYLYTGSDCYFDYSIVKIDYESPYIKNNYSNSRTKFNISYIYETQFYNKYFTEFDLELNGMKIKYSNSDKKNKHYISIANITADNLTLNDNTLSTSYMDRGYKEYRITIYFEQNLSYDQRIGFLLTSNNREYSSTIIEDQLHNNRRHMDQQIAIEYSFFPHDIRNKIIFKSRIRDTFSPHEWVQDLKSFKLYSIEYIIYFNKKGFK